LTMPSILTINTGSSSLKSALYAMVPSEQRRLLAEVARIGHSDSRLHVVDARGQTLLDQPGDLPDHAAAVGAWLQWLHQQGLDREVQGVGHRVVHGGNRYRDPQPVTPALLEALQALVPIDPEHLPQAIAAIQAATRAFPSVPQVACFDTAFHRHMPRVARTFALPRALYDEGLLRLGFHGLSYAYLVEALRAADPPAIDGRVILAHLGNGASMAAVRGGVSVDTTMGFTPTGGLVMGTRPGDLDPGVLLYLLRTRGLSPDALSNLLNRESGMLGVSGRSGDVQDLLAREADDPAAAEAIALFCYQARKHLAAMAAALGGVDTLVFTAGIGEHSPTIRRRVVEGLDFLGLGLDEARNAANAPIISPPDGPVVVRVMHTDEEVMIARYTQRLVSSGGPTHGNPTDVRL
jgi:acetate kinase